MTYENGDQIQAFPIHAGTFIGTASSLDASPYKLVHAVDDVVVDLTFESGQSVSVSIAAGGDIALGRGCEAITSSAEVWIS